MTAIYEQFRAAWATNQSFSLDRVAERLASLGHTQTELYEALEQLLLEVRSEGVDDEAEERIMGVMDRITGWCRPAHHIKTREATTTNGTHSKPAVGTVS